jgi:hypothetical protein
LPTHFLLNKANWNQSSIQDKWGLWNCLCPSAQLEIRPSFLSSSFLISSHHQEGYTVQSEIHGKRWVKQ